MGEIALRRLAAGMEIERGLAVPATKRLYGTITTTRTSPRRYAVEDRGSFTDKFRANPKLTEAGFTLAADATFEDLPYYLAHVLNGDVAGVGSAGTGYTWAFVPDINTDTLKTSTLEAGDDSIAWQGSLGTIDTADFTLPMDDALTCSLGGFVQDWLVQSSEHLPTAFAGFTPGLPERLVETVMGYQTRVYVDQTGTPPGTTQVVGRFKTATLAIHNQNKRKYFGDASPLFTKLGRGRRQCSAVVTFEAADTAQYADYHGNRSMVLRLQLIGTAIPGTSLGTTAGDLAAGATVTTIPVTALAAAVPGGTGISLGGQTFAVAAGGAALGAVAIPVQSQEVDGAVASGETVMAARTMNFDLWGVWEVAALGAVDTNTTFAFTLQAVYDVSAGHEIAVTILNGAPTL